MPQAKLKLSFIRVQEWEQALELMDVRNECRDGMTHDTGWIDRKQQVLFFDEHLSTFRGDNKYEAYLLYDDHFPIGYGLLKWDGDKYWMTAGLIKEYRKRGLSRFLISYITEMGHREGNEVWIDVWKDNLALVGDIRVGYEVMQEKIVDGKTLLIMKHYRERPHKSRETIILSELRKIPNPPVMSFEEFVATKFYNSEQETHQVEIEEVNQIAIESYD